jgi:Fic family protein
MARTTSDKTVKAYKAILKLAKRNKGTTYPEIAIKLDITYNMAQYYVNRLRFGNYVYPLKRGPKTIIYAN